MQKLEDWKVNNLRELHKWASKNMETGKFPQYLRTALRVTEDIIKDHDKH
jgi:hypothetical protein